MWRHTREISGVLHQSFSSLWQRQPSSDPQKGDVSVDNEHTAMSQQSPAHGELAFHSSMKVLFLRREFRQSSQSLELPTKWVDSQQKSSCALKLTAPIPSGLVTVTLRENMSSFSWLSPSVPVGKSSTRGAAFCSSGNSLCTGSVGKGEETRLRSRTYLAGAHYIMSSHLELKRKVGRY